MAIIGEFQDNYPGGFAIVDCAGWDRYDSTTQTVPGLYKQFSDAIASGKMIITINETQTVTGETDHWISSPNIIRAFNTDLGIVAVSNRLITPDDEVNTIT